MKNSREELMNIVMGIAGKFLTEHKHLNKKSLPPLGKSVGSKTCEWLYKGLWKHVIKELRNSKAHYFI